MFQAYHSIICYVDVCSWAMASRALSSCCRRETLPLWLGRLWVEVRPLRRTDQALPQTHRAPPLPVPEVRPGLLQVGPPRLTHEKALLTPETVDVTHTARREFSIFSQWGKEPSWKALQSWSSSRQVLWTDNQETGGNPKTNQRTERGSVTGSSNIPILNPTWIFLDLQNAKGVTGSCGCQGIN